MGKRALAAELAVPYDGVIGHAAEYREWVPAGLKLDQHGRGDRYRRYGEGLRDPDDVLDAPDEKAGEEVYADYVERYAEPVYKRPGCMPEDRVNRDARYRPQQHELVYPVELHIRVFGTDQHPDPAEEHQYAEDEEVQGGDDYPLVYRDEDHGEDGGGDSRPPRQDEHQEAGSEGESQRKRVYVAVIVHDRLLRPGTCTGACR